MQYLTADQIVFYLTISANIFYALLFIYHFTKKNSNKSLMILAGCLCIAMAFVHTFTSYKDSLDKTSQVFYNIAINYYVIWMMVNFVLFFAIFSLHQICKVKPHYTTSYIYSCLLISVLLNATVHFDIVVLGNRNTDWLYITYTYAEILMTCFMFFSMLFARSWSEVFAWCKNAHSLNKARNKSCSKVIPECSYQHTAFAQEVSFNVQPITFAPTSTPSASTAQQTAPPELPAKTPTQSEPVTVPIYILPELPTTKSPDPTRLPGFDKAPMYPLLDMTDDLSDLIGELNDTRICWLNAADPRDPVDYNYKVIELVDKLMHMTFKDPYADANNEETDLEDDFDLNDHDDDNGPIH